MGNSSSQQDSSAQAADSQTPEDEAPEFAPTQMDDNPVNLAEWWSESTDGRCSENAALFAASQPAPLSIV